MAQLNLQNFMLPNNLQQQRMAVPATANPTDRTGGLARFLFPAVGSLLGAPLGPLGFVGGGALGTLLGRGLGFGRPGQSTADALKNEIIGSALGLGIGKLAQPLLESGAARLLRIAAPTSSTEASKFIQAGAGENVSDLYKQALKLPIAMRGTPTALSEKAAQNATQIASDIGNLPGYKTGTVLTKDLINTVKNGPLKQGMINPTTGTVLPGYEKAAAAIDTFANKLKSLGQTIPVSNLEETIKRAYTTKGLTAMFKDNPSLQPAINAEVGTAARNLARQAVPGLEQANQQMQIAKFIDLGAKRSAATPAKVGTVPALALTSGAVGGLANPAFLPLAGLGAGLATVQQPAVASNLAYGASKLASVLPRLGAATGAGLSTLVGGNQNQNVQQPVSATQSQTPQLAVQTDGKNQWLQDQSGNIFSTDGQWQWNEQAHQWQPNTVNIGQSQGVNAATNSSTQQTNLQSTAQNLYDMALQSAMAGNYKASDQALQLLSSGLSLDKVLNPQSSNSGQSGFLDNALQNINGIASTYNKLGFGPLSGRSYEFSIGTIGGAGVPQDAVALNEDYNLLKLNILRAYNGARISDADFKLADKYIPKLSDTQQTAQTKLQRLATILSDSQKNPPTANSWTGTAAGGQMQQFPQQAQPQQDQNSFFFQQPIQ